MVRNHEPKVSELCTPTPASDITPSPELDLVQGMGSVCSHDKIGGAVRPCCFIKGNSVVALAATL